MKFRLLSLLLLLPLLLQAQNDYFFPDKRNFNADIPSPESFLGYAVGDFHTRHDRLVAYFEELADLSPKASITTIGYTYEHRPQIILTITSESNHNNLENLRQEHLKISDPSQAMPDLSGVPAIIVLGYNVHGNEPSSSEAAMLTAYYLLASEEPAVNDYLENAIIHIEPVLNPDGRDRHTNWANMHKGYPLVADPNDREHNEVWPSGRVNHYWYDLNRDWLPLSHVESQARIRFYHQWYPNLGTDYHEMGTSSTYFFEPTKPFGSENPIVPRTNYDGLNNLMKPYFAQSLDDIGSLYFTKELYDNSYPGYGSTYQDIHGGLGLVFEQASSRGHLQSSDTRDVSFPFTIRNHLMTSIATVKGVLENKETFQKHQREFFNYAVSEGRKDPAKAWLFGDANDISRTNIFLDLLLQHKIKVFENNQTRTVDGIQYTKGSSYLVPTDQRQYLMVKSFFEPVKEFYDSVFYDASTWTMSLASGLPHTSLSNKIDLSNEVTKVPERNTSVEMASYAYLIDWKDYAAPKALYHLLKNNVYVHTAFKPFTTETSKGSKDFGYGTLMIAVADQDMSSSQLYDLVKEAAEFANIPIHATNTGLSTNGIDLGSRNFKKVNNPRAMMIVGEGVYLYEAGEVWHLLDSKVNMPITKVDKIDLGRIDLNDYSTLIMVNGRYNDLTDDFVESVKRWLSAGNTLIAQKSAVEWAIDKELVKEELINPDEAETQRMDYVMARNHYGSKVIGGSIYEVNLDLSHPIAFGYSRENIPVYRNSNIFLKPSKNNFSTVAKYTQDPWLSGYVKSENIPYIRQSASIVVSKVGRGRAILMPDNANFRGYWYGTNKLFLNALFFGELISVP